MYDEYLYISSFVVGCCCYAALYRTYVRMTHPFTLCQGPPRRPAQPQQQQQQRRQDQRQRAYAGRLRKPSSRCSRHRSKLGRSATP